MIAQCFNVDHASHVGRTSAVVLLPDDTALVIDDVGATTKGVDGRRFFGKEIVCPHVGGDNVHVIV